MAPTSSQPPLDRGRHTPSASVTTSVASSSSIRPRKKMTPTRVGTATDTSAPDASASSIDTSATRTTEAISTSSSHGEESAHAGVATTVAQDALASSVDAGESAGASAAAATSAQDAAASSVDAHAAQTTEAASTSSGGEAQSTREGGAVTASAQDTAVSSVDAVGAAQTTETISTPSAGEEESAWASATVSASAQDALASSVDATAAQAAGATSTSSAGMKRLTPLADAEAATPAPPATSHAEAPSITGAIDSARQAWASSDTSVEADVAVATREQTRAWREDLARIGRQLVGEPGGTGGAGMDGLFSQARAIVDGRLRELMSVSLLTTDRADQPASWDAVAADTLISLLGTEVDRILKLESDGSNEDARVETLEDIARALGLVGFIRRTFGTVDFADRVVDTVRTCAWLSHVVQALFELVRVLDAQLRTSSAPTPLASTALLHTLREERLLSCVSYIDDAFRRSVDQRREFRERLLAAEAGEVDATRRFAVLSSQLEDERELVVDLRNQLKDALDQQARLRARVRELEQQLDESESMRQPAAGLSREQAAHVFDFLWRHGCGQGDSALWGKLVSACAHADADRAPIDVSLIVTRVGRSARFVQDAPPAGLLDTSGLLSIVSTAAPSRFLLRRSPSASAVAALLGTSSVPGRSTSGGFAFTTSSASAAALSSAQPALSAPASQLQAPASSSLSRAMAPSVASSTSPSVRRQIDFLAGAGDAASEHQASDTAEVDDDAWDDPADEDYKPDDDGGASPPTLERTAPAASTGSHSARRQAPGKKKLVHRPASSSSASSAPPVIAIDTDSAAEGSDEGPHTPRGVKRRASAISAADAMSAQKLAPSLGTEGIDSTSGPTPKHRRSSSGTPTTTPTDAAASSRPASAEASQQSTAASAQEPSASSGSTASSSADASALVARDPGQLAPAASTTTSANSTGALTFSGPAAAIHVADYTAVPCAQAGEQLTDAAFKHVNIPFALGSVRGRSSVVPYRHWTDVHYTRRFNFTMQKVIGEQSPFSPNYEPTRSKSPQQLARYGPRGFAAMEEDVLAVRPWNDMWRQRVRYVFLFDPTKLSRDQFAWVERVLTFMYEHRRHYWERQHWYTLSRLEQVEPAVKLAYLAREGSSSILTSRFRALIQSAPPGVSTSLFWSEPAFWWVPAKPCGWPLESVSKVPLVDQLRQLDEEEPVRVGWTCAPGRFVEALIREQLPILDSHSGKCWELPPPWNDPDYRPEV